MQQGQPLMRIDDTKFASEFGEVRERRAAMAARVLRLEAEAQGRDKSVFPEELVKVRRAPSRPKATCSRRARKGCAGRRRADAAGNPSFTENVEAFSIAKST